MKKPILNLLSEGAAFLSYFTLKKDKNKIPLYILIFFAFSAAFQQQCKCKFEDQFNNANAEPELLEITLEPCSFADEFYAPCWETPGEIDANVIIEVRTGSFDPDSPVPFTPDPIPYDELDEDREDMSCSILGANNKFTVNVPKVGAYALVITIRSKSCSFCCWGADDTQCGTPSPTPVPGTSQWQYTAGKPKWVVEQTFVAGTNRPVALNGSNTAKWTPDPDDYMVRKCSSCGGCTIIR